MNTKKTFTTLTGAYTYAEKSGATRFTTDGLASRVHECILRAIDSKSAHKVAMWNLAKLDKTLYALECTSTLLSKSAYKWTAIGTFDSDGLLYPVGTPIPAPAPVKDKPQPKTTKRKPTHAKGDNKPTPKKAPWQTEIDAFAGTGRENNKKVASILRKHNMSAQIGSEGWTYWEGVR